MHDTPSRSTVARCVSRWDRWTSDQLSSEFAWSYLCHRWQPMLLPQGRQARVCTPSLSCDEELRFCAMNFGLYTAIEIFVIILITFMMPSAYFYATLQIAFWLGLAKVLHISRVILSLYSIWLFISSCLMSGNCFFSVGIVQSYQVTSLTQKNQYICWIFTAILDTLMTFSWYQRMPNNQRHSSLLTWYYPSPVQSPKIWLVCRSAQLLSDNSAILWKIQKVPLTIPLKLKFRSIFHINNVILAGIAQKEMKVHNKKAQEPSQTEKSLIR